MLTFHVVQDQNAGDHITSGKWSDFFLCNPSREDKASYCNLTVTRCSRLPDECGHLLATRNRAVVIKRCVTSEVLNQFIMVETTVPYKMSLKPGSRTRLINACYFYHARLIVGKGGDV